MEVDVWGVVEGESDWESISFTFRFENTYNWTYQGELAVRGEGLMLTGPDELIPIEAFDLVLDLDLWWNERMNRMPIDPVPTWRGAPPLLFSLLSACSGGEQSRVVVLAEPATPVWCSMGPRWYPPEPFGLASEDGEVVFWVDLPVSEPGESAVLGAQESFVYATWAPDHLGACGPPGSSPPRGDVDAELWGVISGWVRWTSIDFARTPTGEGSTRFQGSVQVEDGQVVHLASPGGLKVLDNFERIIELDFEWQDPDDAR